MSRAAQNYRYQPDFVGEEGVNKAIESVGGQPLEGKSLYPAALASDLISNGLYYCTIGSTKKKHLLVRGASCGLAAVMGALALTKRLGPRR
jgi:hypothetical protein